MLQAFGSSTGLKVCIALSAAGHLIAVIFTSAKGNSSYIIASLVLRWGSTQVLWRIKATETVKLTSR
jgi:hypothetical protein